MMKAIFVSAGMLVPKKGDFAHLRKHYYVNYGLIGLATQMAQRLKFESVVIHGRFYSPEVIARDVIRYSQSKTIIFLSIPSAQAISWALSFITNVNAARPDMAVIVGGRWVVPSLIEYMPTELSAVSSFVSGFGEHTLELIISDWLNGHLAKIYSGDIDKPEPFGSLSYQLCLDANYLTPSVEVGRGCGLGCNFCAERNVELTKLKSPEKILREFSLYHKTLGAKNFYLECSLFAPSQSWCNSFLKLSQNDDYFSWRTESRADVLSPKKVELLAKSGLKVLDIGLESASPLQLTNMSKTREPAVYLEKASQLLKSCFQNGVKTKVNILFGAGETPSTVGQTREWLTEHGNYITGVSVGSIVGYGTAGERAAFRRELAPLGCAATNESGEKYWDEFHLSKELCASQASETARELSRQFMNSDEYFDLKSFSYLDKSYSRSEFLRDIALISEDDLQFAKKPL